MINTIVGQTLESGEIIPHMPIDKEKLHKGDIVYIASDTADISPQWYPVYEDGSKGLRFWCVTEAYAQAVADMAIWEQPNPYAESVASNGKESTTKIHGAS